MTGEREERLRALAQRLGHRFADLALLDRALTHASLANETAALHRADNEALEFLGDSVLGMVATDLLHRRDPDGAEGAKSRRRARLVSEPSLRLETDMTMGKRLGLATVFVLTGVTRPDDPGIVAIAPDLVLGSMRELVDP